MQRRLPYRDYNTATLVGRYGWIMLSRYSLVMVTLLAMALITYALFCIFVPSATFCFVLFLVCEISANSLFYEANS